MRKMFLDPKLVWLVALWTVFLSLPPSGSAWAMPSESTALVQPGPSRDAQIARITEVLSGPEARLHLGTMGVSDAQLQEALASMDDAGLAELSGRAETIRVAGDGLGALVAILVIVLLIVLIVQLMDKKIEIKDRK